MFTTYVELIQFAQSQSRVKSSRHYFEKHHILPRYLGGSDEPSNLVLLTVAEHVEAHYLRYLEETDSHNKLCELNSAFLIFSTTSQRRSNLKQRAKMIQDFLSDPEYQSMIEEIKKSRVGLPHPRACTANFWIQIENQLPVKYEIKTAIRKLRENPNWAAIGQRCPQCDKPNSIDSFACCKEHEDEYLSKLRTQKSTNASDRVAQSWSNESTRRSRASGISRSQKGVPNNTKWMTRDQQSKQVPLNEVDKHLSEGWKLGRHVSPEARESMKRAWTPEVRAKISSSYEGRVYVCNDTTFCKRIPIEELESHLSQGWRKGRNYSLVPVHSGYKQKRSCKRVWIMKGEESKLIDIAEFDKRVSEGWKKGRYMSDETRRKISESQSARLNGSQLAHHD